MNKAERSALRKAIADLQSLWPLTKVPQRIVEADAETARKWKEYVANPPYHMTNPPGDTCSGPELQAIRQKIGNYLNQVL